MFSQNAIPATIGIIDGRIKVGLTDDQFEILASKKNGKETFKTSRRDLSFILSNGANGGTTVAATTFISNSVGIKIFATGGIGGVHRDGQDSMDISADLIELGKTSVAVVSSGVKSILDIPRTLEYLVSFYQLFSKQMLDMPWNIEIIFIFLGNSWRNCSDIPIT